MTKRARRAPSPLAAGGRGGGYLFAWANHGGQSGRQEQTRRRARRGDVTGHPRGKPLIESDRVEGTVVYDFHGNRIGTIKRAAAGRPML
jgi:hypothetical protein